MCVCVSVCETLSPKTPNEKKLMFSLPINNLYYFFLARSSEAGNRHPWPGCTDHGNYHSMRFMKKNRKGWSTTIIFRKLPPRSVRLHPGVHPDCQLLDRCTESTWTFLGVLLYDIALSQSTPNRLGLFLGVLLCHRA